MTTRFYNTVFFLFVFTTLLTSCSHRKIDENNPQDLIKDAEEDITDKKYHYALDKLKNIRNKFPYSHVSTDAQLRVADVHFMEEAFVESAAAYETFRDLHPKHEKADYVLFRIGESYFNQLPAGEDRDMSSGPKAIETYRELISLYPQSQYNEQAQKHLKECVEKLAGKERYIADFYYKTGIYDSAALRYEKITKKFSDASMDEYAFWRWGLSLVQDSKELSKAEQKDVIVTEAKHVYRMYLSKYPGGRYAKEVGNWLEENGGL